MRPGVRLICCTLLALSMAACGAAEQEPLPEPDVPGEEQIDFLSAAEEEPPPLRYTAEKAVWSRRTGDFPEEWIAEAVLAVEGETGVEELSFTRGWRRDFDGDGLDEAILLFYGPKDPDSVFMNGDSHFVYVGGDGTVQYLVGGVDEGNEHAWNMEGWTIHYPGFDHILLHTGNQTMAGGSWSLLYRSHGSSLEELLADHWFDLDSGVFLEAGGPQGHGPGFYFWDTARDQYSGIGPVEMTPEAFVEQFHRENLVPDWEGPEPLTREEAESLTPDRIDRVMVYGGRYYLLHMEVTWNGEKSMDYVQWRRDSGGNWTLDHFGWMGSLGAGGVPEERMVYHVEMDAVQGLGEGQG